MPVRVSLLPEDERAELREFVAGRIRFARHQIDRTQGEIARVLGVSVQWWSEVERGRYIPSVPEMLVIARMFGRPLIWFLDPRYPIDPPLDELNWAAIFPDQPERAQAHAALDEALLKNRTPEVTPLELAQLASKRAFTEMASAKSRRRRARGT